jgi:hypothetical protein
MKFPPIVPRPQIEHDAAPVERVGSAEIGQDRAGPGAVRLMFEDLASKGAKRPRGLTVGAWAAAVERMAGALAYLTRDGLAMLAEQLARRADHMEHFPSEIITGNLARLIQEAPPSETRLVPNYMRSRAGCAAWDRGPEYAVLLLRSLVARRAPPSLATWRDIDGDAPFLAAKAERARERIGRGEARIDDAAILRAWSDEVASVRALVFPSAVVASGSIGSGL